MVFSKGKPKTKSLLQLGSQGSVSAEIIAPKIFNEDEFDMAKSEQSQSQEEKSQDSEPLAPPINPKKAVFTPIKDGWGTITWPSGDRYEGNVKGRKKHGYGVMKWVVGGNSFWYLDMLTCR